MGILKFNKRFDDLYLKYEDYFDEVKYRWVKDIKKLNVDVDKVKS